MFGISWKLDEDAHLLAPLGLGRLHGEGEFFRLVVGPVVFPVHEARHSHALLDPAGCGAGLGLRGAQGCQDLGGEVLMQLKEKN